jgi:hypothetical protein
MNFNTKALLLTVCVFLALPASLAAQTVTITGTVVDSVTLQPVANAVVTLNENTLITILSDAAGGFVLSGQTGIVHRMSSGIAGGLTDATTVDIFNSRGERVCHMVNESNHGGLRQFDGTRNSQGLYYVRTRDGFAERLAVALGFGLRENRSGTANGCAKATAGYNLTITKNNFATKQVSVANATANTGTILFRAVEPSLPVNPMKRISVDKPAYASGSAGVWDGPALANDTSCYKGWSSDKIPAWIAYDLSSVPLAQRQKILVVWYDPRMGGFSRTDNTQLPRDYTIEINMAPGGGSAAPTTGWTTLLTVTGNTICSRHHEMNMAGANWIRMNVTGSADVNIMLDLDVYSAPEGITDSWLLMGDSITSMAFARPWNDLQNLVMAANPNAYPAELNAGVGGTSSWTGLSVIDSMLQATPARFIALAYGTNDHPVEGSSTFLNRMDTLCQKIIAAGRIPVVPRVIWPNSTDPADGLKKALMIDTLYTRYPTQVMKGPDLYNIFKDHSEWIPVGDVHPNGVGMEVLRQSWSVAMLKAYQ